MHQNKPIQYYFKTLYTQNRNHPKTPAFQTYQIFTCQVIKMVMNKEMTRISILVKILQIRIK